MSGPPSSLPSARADIVLMSGYHSPQVEVDVRLNTNEAPDPPPAEMTERLAEALGSLAWNRYPDRSAMDLRRAIAGIEDVAAGQVFAANGSNEVLQAVCLAYGGAGRTALTFEPTYALHSHISRVVGMSVVEGERGGDFALSAAGAAAVVRGAAPAITFLCSPNNPTGRVEPPEVVEAVLDAVAEVGGLLVVDEAYGQFAPWSAVALVGAGVPLVVTRTYSKTWSMAAARLGYLIGPEPLVAQLEKVILPYHLDAVSQIVGTIALDYVDEMRARVAALVEERGRVSTALGAMAVDLWPTGANFILFRPRSLEGREVWQALLDRSVLVRDCSSWPRLEGCLRVTIGTPAENDRFLAALDDVLTGSPGSAVGVAALGAPSGEAEP